MLGISKVDDEVVQKPQSEYAKGYINQSTGYINSSVNKFHTP